MWIRFSARPWAWWQMPAPRSPHKTLGEMFQEGTSLFEQYLNWKPTRICPTAYSLPHRTPHKLACPSYTPWSRRPSLWHCVSLLSRRALPGPPTITLLLPQLTLLCDTCHFLPSSCLFVHGHLKDQTEDCMVTRWTLNPHDLQIPMATQLAVGLLEGT